MRLLESGTILLIIGAAVIGPIERRGGEFSPNEVRCVGNCAFLLESVAKTCERAIREIGAELKATAYSDDKKFAYILGDWPGATGVNWSIRCIPAPMGLRP